MKIRLATFLSILALPINASQVLTVGPSGSGAQYEVIQDAINAASPGDVVMIEPGTYLPFILNKPLHIQGAGPQDTVVKPPDGPLYVQTIAIVLDIPADEVAVIAGLGGLPGDFEVAMQGMINLSPSEGTVILHDLDLETFQAEAAVAADGVDRVLVSASRLDGGGASGFGMQRAALQAEDSRLWAVDSLVETPILPFAATKLENLTVLLADAEARFAGCTLLGPSFEAGFSLDAGDTLHASGSQVSFERSMVTGGIGTTGSGGYAARLFEGSTADVFADATLSAGVGGAGVALTLDATSQSTSFGNVSPTLSLSTPSADAGDLVSIALHGNPGTPAVLLGSAAPSAGAIVPGILGDVFVDLTAPVNLGVFVLDGAGQENVQFFAPPVSVPSLATFQWVELGAAFTASNPAFVTLQ